MKEHIKNAIDHFLNSQVYNRALFIAGTWGSGKTYFLKKILKKYLKSKELELFYLSLNGIDSVADIKKMLISQAILTTSENKKNKFWNKFFTRAQKATQYFDKADVIFAVMELSDFLNLDKTVFCFDDLERIGKNVTIDQVLGFINTELIEHKGCNVILVGDITKKQLKENSFGAIREKYIGWTINYKSNLSEVLESILASLNDEEKFVNFINENKDLILSIHNTFEFKNFRTLQFIIETLRILYRDFQDKHSTVFGDLIYFTIIICHEYKE